MAVKQVLITGANRGLGLGFVKHYAALGWRVFAACRNPADAGDLAAVTGNIERLQLRMESDADIHDIASRLGQEKIDLLLLNAGIFNPDPPLGKFSRKDWLHMLDVNCVGPALLAEALRNNLAAAAWVVGITSGLGSIGGNTNGDHYYYRSSKAALNMMLRTLSLDLKSANVGAAIIHPGWVKTDMGGPNAPTSIDDSISNMTKVIAGLRPEDSGKFFGPTGGECQW